MRNRLTLTRESLTELSFLDLSAVVGAATGEWTCDISETLLTPFIVTGATYTTEGCDTLRG